MVNQRQSDVTFSNYKFRDGETLPQLRIHYATLGNPHKNAEGVVDPNLNQIKTKAYALNFADDEFYRDSLQVLQRESKLPGQTKVVVRPISGGSVGHLSMAHPDLWKDHVYLFMNWLDTK